MLHTYAIDYTNVKCKPLKFQVGDRVMLKVSPWKGVIRFGKRGKLSPRYIEPFKILARIGPVAYKLKLSQELSGIHNTFHKSNLKKCLSDENFVIPLDEIKLNDKLHFIEELVEIMDREVKQLKQIRIPIVKVHKEKYLEQPILTAPVAAAPDQPIPHVALATYNKWVKNQKEIAVMMLLTMDLEIQRNLAHLGANDMLKDLKALYSKQAEQELLQTSYIDQLERLGHPVTLNLEVSLILVGLSKEYDSFMQNYNMHSMGKIVNALHAILKLHEETLPNKVAAPALYAIRAGKGKMAYANVAPSYAPKPKNPPPPKKDNPAKDAICHHCGEVGCGTHICNTTQGLRGSKKLNPGALSLYIGNGQRATVEAIGNYHLCLPSGLVIILNNCHYAPSITRGIISVSRLYDDGFINRFELNNAISVSKNNVVYFSAILRDGVYEIKMSCSNTNDSSMYAVSNKRAKLNLDSSLLWHCRLGHISKKRIEKLQHEGLLNSNVIESLGKYVSCMSRKMARKPYSHQVEKVKDLLGLIQTDEVENQLGKTIKSLRSDHGGEYMSQEFLDHLKEHGIIAHRTPPYTPQHNRVSERRNRTLLDMVPFMMSQTTLPKSFWDYALESAARIFNMVPTKKGCEALVKRDILTKPDKLEPRSFKCIFIGYLKETMGYSFYNPSENKVFVARNAELFKSNLIDQEASGSLKDPEIIQEEDTNPSLDTSLDHE
ncbi:retrotransposon protein, putative, ty1-copia subclass [Tanacetum coccineum]